MNEFDVITERAEARTQRYGVTALDVRLRVAGQPDVAIRVSNESTEVGLAEPDDSPALVTDAAARLLMLWGRQPPAVRRIVADIDAATLLSLQHWLY